MKAKLNMIGVFVENLKTMAEFYRDVLGFSVKDWADGSPYAEFDNEGVRFSMFERSMLPKLLGQEPSYPKGINGTFELALDLPKFENVDAVFKRVVEAGATPIYKPRNEPWGMRSSMISDPEGNLIEIGSWNKGK
jgi:uncharacterized glyoxalase superfamily protein PhnB